MSTSTLFLRKRACMVSLALLCYSGLFSQADYSNFVNPFIGTGGHGHTFPGATAPFGMVQLSPDTRIDGSWDGCSGYHYSDSSIYGFSHTHLSGTGVSDYGDIALLPVANLSKAEIHNKRFDYRNYKANFQHKNEKAHPGYYAVKLDNGIDVELTASSRVGMHKYVFPKKTKNALIIQLDHRDKTLESSILKVDDKTITGYRISDAWATKQVIYFRMEFSESISDCFIKKDSTSKNPHHSYAVLSFAKLKKKTLYVKVALSMVNTEGCKKNMLAEIPHWNFEQVKNETKTLWNKELQKIEVKGGSEEEKIIFYTALYHAFIQPNNAMDVDGWYRGRDNKIHFAENFNYYTVFSLWDTFRAAHPLYTIVDKKRSLDFIKTFLKQYEFGGRLPVWELASNETDCMIGYHSVSVICDAAVKGIDAFDMSLALDAMRKSATWNHLGLPAYIDHGFLSIDDEHESVSKTLEYAYDDWCIGVFAERMGKKDVAQEYYERAQYWKNLFDPETGFIRPIKNGSWLRPFDPKEVNNNFTEANAWQYAFFVPHELKGLMEKIGGEAAFEKKLDELFSTSSVTTGREQADITGLIGQYAHGNEPSHHMAYLYNLVNKPGKAQDIIRKIQQEFYKNSPDGLIGNEDCGQMSAWYVFSAMGFYPVCPGIPFYVIGNPIFDEVTIHLENGKDFKLIAKDKSDVNKYVQSINDTQIFSISHADIEQGNTVVLQMGAKPSETKDPQQVFLNYSSFDDIIQVPIFETNSQSFRDSLEVKLISRKSPSKIYYTLDGSEPGMRSNLYTAPFYIKKTATVKAVTASEKKWSKVNTANYYLMPNNYKVAIASKYNPQYTAGGDQGLIDGIHGNVNWRKGGWQGYQAQDFEAVIDMGELKTIRFISASFLQDMRSWILLPKEVEFYVSADNKAYQLLGKAKPIEDPKEDRVLISNLYTNQKSDQPIRYVKVIAKNFGKLPEWHMGAGGDAFIFIDEIEIK